jgi:malate dehydrogenase (oxaloacetate-decarboxylating)
MLQPSFGAVNLEDISQPNCFKVLDTLQEVCDIPVWHDDAQGTACVTLAGLINALKIAGKNLANAKIVLLGAGASNTTIARFILTAGGDPAKMIVFDSKSALHAGRADVQADTRFYRKWELCQQTNPQKVTDFAQAMTGADVLIALSTPGPGTVKPEWISLMAPKAIVFACANPVPEIYPYAAKAAGAYIVATGRGDFPNQVNNSVGFPGILKGALLARARKVSDGMAIAAAYSLAQYAEQRGINPENIIATMDEPGVFPHEAADVAMQAIQEGLARVTLSREAAYAKAEADIQQARALVDHLMEQGMIARPPQAMLQEALEWAVRQVS